MANRMMPYTTGHKYHGRCSDGIYITVTYDALTARVEELQIGLAPRVPTEAWNTALDPDNWDSRDDGYEVDEARMALHRQAEQAELHRHDLDYSPIDGHSYEYLAACESAKNRWR